MTLPLIALLQASGSTPPTARGGVVAFGLIYLAVILVIAAWAARRTRTPGDFYVAGRGIGLVVMTLAAMSATFSGFAFIGGPGLLYSAGLGALFIFLPAALTNAMSAWVLARRMRALAETRDLITVPDAIGVRYDSPLAQGLAALAILVAVVGYLATNVLALGVVIDVLFGTGLTAGIWLGAAVTLAYSATGGILAGVYASVFQGAIMLGAAGLVFLYALDAGGGLSGISTSILEADPVFLRPWGALTPLGALSFFFVFSVGALGQPHVIHKFYMLRDPRRLRWYPLLVTAAFLVVVALGFSVGLSVKALVARGDMPAPPHPDQAAPAFVLAHTPTLLATLVFAGAVSAIMSTVNAFLNIGAAAVTHDLPVALGRRLTHELRWGRIATVAVAVAAALMAQLSDTLVALLGVFGFGLFACTLVPSLAIGLNWEGATPAGAVASIAVGLLFTLVFEVPLGYLQPLALPAGVPVAGAALVLTIIVFVAVSLATGGGINDKERPGSSDGEALSRAGRTA